MAMAMAMAMAAAEAMERRLRSDGWHVKDGAIAEILEQLRDDAAAPSPPSRHSADPSYEALVAELLDSDLKTIGLPCLPDPSAIQHLSKFQGPLILQVVSVRNISQSSSKSYASTGEEQQHGRLLRILLTDGHSVVSVLEYRAMPKFSLATAPGTKVSLKNVIPIQSGFILGDANSIILLGGHVEALHQGWEIERKYSLLARMGLAKTERTEGVDGPPMFRGLTIPKYGKANQGTKGKSPASDVPLDSGASTSRSSENGRDRIKDSHELVKSGSRPSSSMVSTPFGSEGEGKVEKDGSKVPEEKIDIRFDALKALGVEPVVPLQNRAAAQRLLERRNESSSGDGHGRGRGSGRGRGRGRRERYIRDDADASTLTLDEWEAQRTRLNPSVVQSPSINDDEALARQLHHQLNVMGTDEAVNIRGASNIADQIRESMFSYSMDKGGDDYDSGSRHYGRGRGRGRGRSRGRRHG